jgi:protein translocase SecG subunit
MFLHGIISVVLIVIILMQSGRGGGLTEGFASAESMFGARTNEFMVKATTIFSGLFLVTCLGLAVLSSQKGKSLMSDTSTRAPAAQAVNTKSDGSETPVTDEKNPVVQAVQTQTPSASGTEAASKAVEAP